MFKKLLSNLPFNPSLIGQVSFYAKRLHHESTVRRAGFVMIALAMMIQMFAIVSPPRASLQASPNTDLINGGFSTKDEAVRHCRNNTQDYKTILNYFGITCENLSDATITSIAPRDNDGKLHSMGRLAYGMEGETPVRVPGVGTLYTRHFWSLNHDPSYKALKVRTAQGKTIFILFGCGNLVTIGVPTPPPPVAQDVCDDTPGLQTDKSQCDKCPNIDGVQTKESQCDVCPNKAGTQNNPDNKCDVCPKKAGIQTTVKQCDVCPDKDGIQVDLDKCDVCPNTPGTQTDKSKCDVCPDRSGVQTNENDCKPCEDAQTNNDLTACLDYKKTASNSTQNIADANNTTAKAGDVIVYTLTTTNSGKINIKDYQVSEGIGDVLDYADLVDLRGGTKGAYDVVTWPKQEIKAGKSAVHLVTVKIKDVIPGTPVSSSDPQHFDMVMTNVYGNAVNINLPGSVIKRTEIATRELPNTGPGTSLVIGFSLTLFIAYFFMRSRLLAKELDIVRADFGNAGGY